MKGRGYGRRRVRNVGRSDGGAAPPVRESNRRPVPWLPSPEEAEDLGDEAFKERIQAYSPPLPFHGEEAGEGFRGRKAVHGAPACQTEEVTTTAPPGD